MKTKNKKLNFLTDAEYDLLYEAMEMAFQMSLRKLSILRENGFPKEAENYRINTYNEIVKLNAKLFPENS